MKKFRLLQFGLTVATLLFAVSCANKEAEISKSADAIDRTVLPIHEPAPATIKELDARNAKAPPRFEVKAPEGAPNVVIVLIDDIGFGASSAFGGPIHMPTLDKMAAEGLRYNRFHTTALCSPTRVALLTGRNHHVNNAGAIMELATAFPGNTGIRPRSVTPLAEILRQNGYSTAAFGKYHETPPWEVSVSGPYDRWPTGSGFDKFYGFIGGETNQWAPAIYDGVDARRAQADARLSLHDRHDRPGDQVGQRPAVADAGQAVLHVLRDRRDACAAPRRRRSGSTSTRASSRAAGTSSARRPSRARRRWASSRRMRS